MQSTDDVIAAIKAHAACADFVTLPTSYVVYYPPTYVIPGGTMVPRRGNDLAELNLLYMQIDDWWKAQRLQVPAQ